MGSQGANCSVFNLMTAEFDFSSHNRFYYVSKKNRCMTSSSLFLHVHVGPVLVDHKIKQMESRLDQIVYETHVFVL